MPRPARPGLRQRTPAGAPEPVNASSSLPLCVGVEATSGRHPEPPHGSDGYAGRTVPLLSMTVKRLTGPGAPVAPAAKMSVVEAGTDGHEPGNDPVVGTAYPG